MDEGRDALPNDLLFLTASPSIRKVEETSVTPRMIAHERREIAEILRAVVQETDPKDLPKQIARLAEQLVHSPSDRSLSLLALLAEKTTPSKDKKTA